MSFIFKRSSYSIGFKYLINLIPWTSVKFDDINFYTMFNKFGIGRATYDVSQELRNDHLSVEEGKKLIKKYDGEFPNVYIKDVLVYFFLLNNLPQVFN